VLLLDNIAAVSVEDGVAKEEGGGTPVVSTYTLIGQEMVLLGPCYKRVNGELSPLRGGQ
jgi:hypothetical protein